MENARFIRRKPCFSRIQFDGRGKSPKPTQGEAKIVRCAVCRCKITVYRIETPAFILGKRWEDDVCSSGGCKGAYYA